MPPFHLELDAAELTEIAEVLIREGFLQEEDRFNAARIRSRMAVRENVPQLTVRDLKEREKESNGRLTD